MSSQVSFKDKISINDLMVQAIVGINTQERVKKQNININLTMFHDVTRAALRDDVSQTINYSHVCKAVVAYTEDSHHYTLESLSHGIAKICCIQFGVDEVTVNVEKPCALSLARCPSVEIHRTKEFFINQEKLLLEQINNEGERKKEVKEKSQKPQPERKNAGKDHTAFIALGSNLGQRDQNIGNALKLMRQFCDIVSTSALYQTPPAYVIDQPAFLNAACKVFTKLSPNDLLRQLKDIESQLGRKSGLRNGPRLIDLDILFYDDVHFHLPDESLVIPHPRLPERDFVLGPLTDIAPDFVHPVLNKTILRLFEELPERKLYRVMPVRSGLWSLAERTLIMGILNATPDSFSDGGDFIDVQDAVRHAKHMVESGADIIDIGGQSTRPTSTKVSPDEEIKRVIPIIRALREEENSWMKNIPISIDTFYAAVAEEAVKAGADVINDISGGTLDDSMFSVAFNYQVPIVLMHMRGTPQTMTQSVYTDYGKNLIEDVSRHLKERAEAAQLAGIPRWNIILDPGIGFAKKHEHALEILQRFKELRHKVGKSYATLIGASRKGFIGQLVGGQGASDAKLRGWGTAATSCAAVAGGANIIRVHDVKEQRDVIKVADAIYLQDFRS